MPVSATVRRISESETSTLTSTVPFGGVNFIALTSTFNRTCSSLTGSPYIAIPSKMPKNPLYSPPGLPFSLADGRMLSRALSRQERKLNGRGSKRSLPGDNTGDVEQISDEIALSPGIAFDHRKAFLLHLRFHRILFHQKYPAQNRVQRSSQFMA